MLLSTLSVYVLIGPRVVFAMAQAGQFPAVAARLTARAEHTRRGDRASDLRRPHPALDRNVREHHRLRGRRPVDLLDAGNELDLRPPLATTRPPRPFRTPGYPVTPAVYLFLTALLTVATFYDRPGSRATPCSSILAGIPFYYIWQRQRPVA